MQQMRPGSKGEHVKGDKGDLKGHGKGGFKGDPGWRCGQQLDHIDSFGLAKEWGEQGLVAGIFLIKGPMSMSITNRSFVVWRCSVATQRRYCAAAVHDGMLACTYGHDMAKQHALVWGQNMTERAMAQEKDLQTSKGKAMAAERARRERFSDISRFNWTVELFLMLRYS